MAGYVGSRIVNTLTNLDGVAIDGAAITNSTIVPVTPFSFRNRIINGNLSNPINQRGAASITTPSSGSTGYTYDRWYYDGSTATPYLYQGIEDKNVNNGTYVISWEGSGINAAWKVSTDTTANNGPDATTGFLSVSNGGTFTVNEGTEYSKHLWIRFDGTLTNLDKVMVEEGTVATPFEHRPYGLELSLCQRYYATSIPQGYTILNFPTGADGAHVIAAGTNDLFGYIPFPVEMRARPTTYIYSSVNRTAGSIRRVTDGNDFAVSSYQPGTSNNKSLVYFNGLSGVSANQQFTFHYVAISEL